MISILYPISINRNKLCLLFSVSMLNNYVIRTDCSEIWCKHSHTENSLIIARKISTHLFQIHNKHNKTSVTVTNLSSWLFFNCVYWNIVKKSSFDGGYKHTKLFFLINNLFYASLLTLNGIVIDFHFNVSLLSMR